MAERKMQSMHALQKIKGTNKSIMQSIVLELISVSFFSRKILMHFLLSTILLLCSIPLFSMNKALQNQNAQQNQKSQMKERMAPGCVDDGVMTMLTEDTGLIDDVASIVIDYMCCSMRLITNHPAVCVANPKIYQKNFEEGPNLQINMAREWEIIRKYAKERHMPLGCLRLLELRDGTVAIGYHYGVIKIWDPWPMKFLSTFLPASRLSHNNDDERLHIMRLAQLPNGDIVSFDKMRKLKVWGLKNGKQRDSLELPCLWLSKHGFEGTDQGLQARCDDCDMLLEWQMRMCLSCKAAINAAEQEQKRKKDEEIASLEVPHPITPPRIPPNGLAQVAPEGDNCLGCPLQ